MRRGLAAALREAQQARCPLIVSRLDRLSRNVHFITGLMEHRVHLIVAALRYSNARSTGENRGYFCGYQNSSKRKAVLGSTACIPIWIPLSRQSKTAIRICSLALDPALARCAP